MILGFSSRINTFMDLIIENTTGRWGNMTFNVTHGRGGIREDKVEGDGATPVGSFPFRIVYYRPDRNDRIKTDLPQKEITQDLGWCDDVEDANYNRPIKLPYSARHEKMWRDDHLYDIVIVIGHNDDPTEKGKGSAVFIHLKHPEGKPTDGCIGLENEDLLHVLKDATLESQLIVKAPTGAKER